MNHQDGVDMINLQTKEKRSLKYIANLYGISVSSASRICRGEIILHDGPKSKVGRSFGHKNKTLDDYKPNYYKTRQFHPFYLVTNAEFNINLTAIGGYNERVKGRKMEEACGRRNES